MKWTRELSPRDKKKLKRNVSDTHLYELTELVVNLVYDDLLKELKLEKYRSEILIYILMETKDVPGYASLYTKEENDSGKFEIDIYPRVILEDLILLNENDIIREIIITIAHEMRHLYQYDKMGKKRYNKEDKKSNVNDDNYVNTRLEKDAEKFSLSFYNKYKHIADDIKSRV